MKKNLKYIIITFISLSIWGCKSQVGEDNNSDGGQKIYLYDNPVLGFDLYALNYGHREVNGTDTVYYIIPNEVARVKDLDIAKNSSAANGDILSPIKLTAFEELKYFTGLETFRLTSNEFTSLDFSNNTNLREIYMNFNWLDTLKIDSLINLEQLEYQGSNSSSAPASSKISSINLTKNTKLVVLELENHLLNELDVSQNTALDEIRVPDNTGTPITIDSLIYDQLSVREGVARQEPSVELPDGAIVVQDDNFGRALKEQGYGGGPISTGEYYIIPDSVNMITFLDVSDNGIIKTSELSYFTALERLDISDNSLDTLDVSSNTNLTYLNADHNTSGVSVMENLILSSSIDSLSIRKTGLRTVDLSSATALTYFHAESGYINSLNVSASTNLVYINIRHDKTDWESGNGLTSIDFSNNSSLETINIFRNGIVDDSGITWWSSGSALTSLDLRSNPTEGGEFTFTIPSDIYATLDDDSKARNIQEEVSGGIPPGAVIINDTALGAALLAGGYASSGLDGGVTKIYVIPSEAEQVLLLDLGTSSLVDVSELSNYSNVQRLYLNDNDIVTLNLSWATSLTALNINTASGFSAITTLTLPSSLDSLAMDKTNLSTVDLSSLTNLEYFIAEQGKIDNLNLSNNTELKVLRVRHTNSGSAWSNGGGIQTIDLSNNSKLEDIYLYRNQLDDGDITWWGSGSGSVLVDLDVQSNPAGTEATFTIPAHIWATLSTESQGRNVTN
ncbi:hypothetical protein KMW28_15295 [Flammeovirga yaeyamensis]|uniref:Uncharacterized protein n=1 Tax=Flammeovirga yaeyamensis TaxID=367791 RepID=A0AAX1N3R1_9BACT|nr:hypothetical protein [Flammeovirga yaeyamensis]MBB3698624.1 hypothetical protein [Flammeovirga yaeyamensis]NMF34028.1 hypothetical protein [Flammeovirga yaeyamensis]QWG01016.1 hypothetical protein KMW28_15295 [Flammeovirga yaeyamensis]